MKRGEINRGDMVRVSTGHNKGKTGRVELVHEVCYDHHKCHYGWEAIIRLENGHEIEEEIRRLESASAVDRLGGIVEGAGD